MKPEPLLPLHGPLSAADRARLLDALTRIWIATTGAQPGDLATDLDRTKRWFDPVAQGQRLRRELADLPPIPDDTEVPGPPWVLEVGPDRVLVTPEGRCAIELLGNLEPSETRWNLGDADTVPLERILGRTVLSWSRHRINSVVSLLSGTDKPLQVSAAGVVIALLVDGCIGPDKALTRFTGSPARDVVDAAFFKAVAAFSDRLVENRRTRLDPRLISGWMLYEVRRRVGSVLVVESPTDEDDGYVWIREDGVEQIIHVVVRDLDRGHRATVSIVDFGDAYDALVAALRSELPRLASYGLAHERPSATRRLRLRFVEAWRSQAGDKG